MEFLLKIRDTIHSWPAEVRQALAGALMLVAALFFFYGWSGVISSRLIALTPAATPSEESSSGLLLSPTPGVGDVSVPPGPTGESLPMPASPALTPTQGIGETLKGVQEVVSGVFAKLGAPARPESTTDSPSAGVFAWVGQGIQDIGSAVGNGFSELADFMYEKLSRYVPPNL